MSLLASLRASVHPYANALVACTTQTSHRNTRAIDPLAQLLGAATREIPLSELSERNAYARELQESVCHLMRAHDPARHTGRECALAGSITPAMLESFYLCGSAHASVGYLPSIADCAASEVTYRRVYAVFGSRVLRHTANRAPSAPPAPMPDPADVIVDAAKYAIRNRARRLTSERFLAFAGIGARAQIDTDRFALPFDEASRRELCNLVRATSVIDIALYAHAPSIDELAYGAHTLECANRALSHAIEFVNRMQVFEADADEMARSLRLPLQTEEFVGEYLGPGYEQLNDAIGTVFGTNAQDVLDAIDNVRIVRLNVREALEGGINAWLSSRARELIAEERALARAARLHGLARQIDMEQVEDKARDDLVAIIQRQQPGNSILQQADEIVRVRRQIHNRVVEAQQYADRSYQSGERALEYMRARVRAYEEVVATSYVQVLASIRLVQNALPAASYSDVVAEARAQIRDCMVDTLRGFDMSRDDSAAFSLLSTRAFLRADEPSVASSFSAVVAARCHAVLREFANRFGVVED